MQLPLCHGRVVTYDEYQKDRFNHCYRPIDLDSMHRIFLMKGKVGDNQDQDQGKQSRVDIIDLVDSNEEDDDNEGDKDNAAKAKVTSVDEDKGLTSSTQGMCICFEVKSNF